MTMNEVAVVSHRSSAESKIALFRSLFRGREDIYARRFESLASGRSGYAPACSNEWRPGVCEKPKIKCADCPNRGFLPVTDQVVRWHLSGADDDGKPFTMGLYPMLLDESCHFLVVDFDGKRWSEDATLDYGYVIVDECHHIPACSFELAVSRAKAKYVTGLSATVVRKDGHQPIVFMQCGPVRHRVDAKRQAANRPFSHEMLVRPTGFRMQGEPEDDARIEFQRVCDQLIRDNSRNLAICSDVVQNVQNGRAPLVLTERVDHLQALADGLKANGLDIVSLQGGMGIRALRSAMARAAESVPGRVLLATGRFIGEGFDNPRLDSLFLTMPVSWRGTIAQYVGRLHRLHEHKREVRVYDYADLDVPMLSRMFDRRCRAYEAAGYSILLPASAAPGWPASVQLPADGHWKHRYSASLRRLLRDGVDETLADLFSNITRPIPLAQPSAPRARSASEAFLFRRLQSLPETRDRFRLNAHLPIPFCPEGHMEVDFLDPASRLVLELDGSQHLADREAYRRDRRKDALLQEHGYVVLRFLAEDLGARLDSVLDEILRALARGAKVS